MKKISLILICLLILLYPSYVSGEEPCNKNEQMIIEKLSPYGLEETVQKIVDNAKAEKWVISGVKDLAKSIEKNGGEKLLPVKLIELCNVDYSGKMLKEDASRYASVMMPCTISVYEKSDGKVYVSFVNTKLMGQMFPGTVGEVMGGPVGEAQSRFLIFLDDK
ncbi:MAG: DUF302 domain-containing protein [Candidatus Eremiobacterota bacterium]